MGCGLLAILKNERFHEIIGGELVHKAMPSIRHGGAQARLTMTPEEAAMVARTKALGGAVPGASVTAELDLRRKDERAPAGK